MLIIDSKDCENIDKALKKYKKKFEKAKILLQLRERQSFTKPSVQTQKPGFESCLQAKDSKRKDRSISFSSSSTYFIAARFLVLCSYCFFMQPAHPIIQPFLDYLKFEKRYSRHTVISYQTDLISFFDYMDYSIWINAFNQLFTYLYKKLAGLFKR